jgi:diguanylate cyclase (GGDEF)-like protein/PAS domain S-box-containing protein
MKRRRGFPAAEVATAIVLIAAIALVLFTWRLSSQTLERSRRWDSALEKISVHVGLSHVWLEEWLGGDRSVDLSPQVYEPIIEAQSLAGALEIGGPSEQGTIDPVHGTALRETVSALEDRLTSLRLAASARTSSPLDQAPGSPADQAYDALFRDALRQVDAAAALVKTHENDDRRFLSRLYLGVVGLLVVLFAALVLGVRRNVRTLRRVGRTHRVILDSAAEGIYGVDHGGRTVFANTAVERVTGWPANELLGKNAHDRLHRPPGEGGPPLAAPGAIEEAIADGTARTVTGDVAWRRDGSSFPVEFTVTPIAEPGEPVAATVVFADITERLAADEQLRFLANHDPLTGLWNRRRFEEELRKLSTETPRQSDRTAMLLIDIDHFKFVNDSHGHRAGDALISEIAHMLQRRCRRTGDIVARLGGDELALILPGADEKRAVVVAGELLAEIRGHVVGAGDRVIRVSASIGIAPLAGHEWTLDEAMTAADVALYEAKSSGRNRFAVHTPGSETHARIEQGLMWAERIRTALENDSFVLLWQPIRNLRTGKVSQHELLLRMRDGEDVIAPSRFLPEAERFGLMPALDRWVVRRAIAVIAASRDALEGPITLEVNVSALSLDDDSVIDLIEKELQTSGVDPANLILEITETTAIGNIEVARQFAERLSRLGCRFALDDFGAGFSSFFYLKHLPADYLKIDGEFVRNIQHDPSDRALVQSMVDISRNLGKQTIAEWVDSAETEALLKEIGVDFAQGFHVGEPTAVPQELLALTAAAAHPG